MLFVEKEQVNHFMSYTKHVSKSITTKKLIALSKQITATSHNSLDVDCVISPDNKPSNQLSWTIYINGSRKLTDANTRDAYLFLSGVSAAVKIYTDQR